MSVNVTIPTLANLSLNLGCPRDRATVDGFLGYAEMMFLYMEGCQDANAWRSAFADFVNGMYEAQLAESGQEWPPSPEDDPNGVMAGMRPLLAPEDEGGRPYWDVHNLHAALTE